MPRPSQSPLFDHRNNISYITIESSKQKNSTDIKRVCTAVTRLTQILKTLGSFSFLCAFKTNAGSNSSSLVNRDSSCVIMLPYLLDATQTQKVIQCRITNTASWHYSKSCKYIFRSRACPRNIHALARSTPLYPQWHVHNAVNWKGHEWNPHGQYPQRPRVVCTSTTPVSTLLNAGMYFFRGSSLKGRSESLWRGVGTHKYRPGRDWSMTDERGRVH
jgi:hypothetical protein